MLRMASQLKLRISWLLSISVLTQYYLNVRLQMGFTCVEGNNCRGFRSLSKNLSSDFQSRYWLPGGNSSVAPCNAPLRCLASAVVLFER